MLQSPGGVGGRGGRPPPPPPPQHILHHRSSSSLRSGVSSDDDDDDEEAAVMRERRQQLVAASLLQSQAAAAAAAPTALQGYLVFEQAILAQQTPGRVSFLDEDRHRQRFLPPRPADTPVTWRLKERMKTVSVALVLCLNIGTDPPDVVRTEPCARKQCWFDPRSTSKAKALETIGNNLQQQYERWQARAKYKQALDPTMEDVKKLCASLRRNAKGDRLLFHYNGHGVPRPTSAGEIWVFNKTYTQYIPLSVHDLRAWVGTPAIYVLDCSGAGVLLPHFLQNPVSAATSAGSSGTGGAAGGGGAGAAAPAPPPAPALLTSSSSSSSASISGMGGASAGGGSSSSQRDCIVLAPCAANELLPANPKFPADLFTACLTTPILVALRWFIARNPLSMGQDLDVDFVDQIPGKLNDRKTPLGELNWIFTAITDTIAWNTLPSPVFQRLFRQDLLVASLFRNFLLADRVLRSFNCTPTSIPRLPSTAQHPLWQAWDLAAECCLSQLIADRSPRLSGVGAEARLQSAIPFFADQLTAFEVWLEFTSASVAAGPGGADEEDASSDALALMAATAAGRANGNGNGGNGGASGAAAAAAAAVQQQQQRRKAAEQRRPPEQLPVVLQVLLSQAHRLRALLLLRRFLDLGPWAVNLALSVGIFPYVLKLLQSPAPELRQVLVCIWARILAFDPSCRTDLVKDNAYLYFIVHLSDASVPPEQRVMAAFILTVIMDDSRSGQRDCLRKGVHKTCAQFLFARETEAMPVFRRWLCLCLGKLCHEHADGKLACLREEAHLGLLQLLGFPHVEVRAAAVYALGTMFGSATAASGAGGGSSNNLAALASPEAGGGMAREAEAAAAAAGSRRVDVSVIGVELLRAFDDASPLVRREAILALALLVTDPGHFPAFVWVARELQRFNAEQQSAAAQQQSQQQQQQQQQLSSPPMNGAGADGLPRRDSHASSNASSVGLAVEDSDEEGQDGGHEPGGQRALPPPPKARGADSPDAKGAGAAGAGGRGWFRALAARLRRQGGETAEHYLYIWLAIRQVAQKEPFPPTAEVAGHIVRVVHERLLDLGRLPDSSTAGTGQAEAPPFPAGPGAKGAGGGLRPVASTSALAARAQVHHNQQQHQQHQHQQQAAQFQQLQRSPGGRGGAVGTPPLRPPPHGLPPRGSPPPRSPSSTRPPQQLHQPPHPQQQHFMLPPPAPPSRAAAGGASAGGAGGPVPGPVALERAVSAQELVRPAAAAMMGGAGAGGGQPGASALHPYPPGHGLHPSHHPSQHPAHYAPRPSGAMAPPQQHPSYPTQHGAVAGASSAARGGPTPPAPSGMPGPPALARHHSMAVPDEHAAALAAAGIAASALQPTARVLAESPSVQWLRQQYQETGLYAWSRRRFAAPSSARASGGGGGGGGLLPPYPTPCSSLATLSGGGGGGGVLDEDPLSPEGQLKLYRRTRNKRALQEAETLANKCASVLGVGAAEEDDVDGFMLEGLDALLSSKQKQQQAERQQQRKQQQQALRLQQKAVFESDAEMTSQLLFHPFEPLLISTDDHARVRVWHYEEGRRLGAFRNETATGTGTGIGSGSGGGGERTGSPTAASSSTAAGGGAGGSRAARITSIGWLNEATTSHLLTGSDDGVVRVWGGVVGAGGPWAPPRLVTAFYAHALAGRGSGLVTKWAHGAGLLLTGGSSDRLRAWDLRREQCVREWGTGGEAAVTCLAASTPPLPPQSGANFSARGMPPALPMGGSGGGGGGGGGPSLVVAGFGDGKAKLFDLRADRDAPVATMAEHAHWLVLADFVKGDRELLTGSLAGEMRFWDLRRTGASLRTVDVGKGPMTAMATHRTCPLMASGSYNQFIKVLTLEGDTLTVIRYHDGILGQRIGPVATLAFHPCRLLMAAGAADSLISIYSGSFPGQ